MADLGALRRLLGVGTVVDTSGNAVPGTTDMTAAWETAMAGGGQVDIPAGTYLLANCTIPANVGDITLNPLGPVIIKWPSEIGGGSGRAMLFNNTGNWSSAVTLTTVANDDTYPSSNAQRLTRLTASAGNFAGWAAHDVVHLMSNDNTYDGFIKAEMARVLFVAGDTSYVILDRQLFYTYNAGANTTIVRRATATPRLVINKGITFEPSEDETDTLTYRSYGLYLMAAVNYDIDIRVTGAYTIAAYELSTFGGRMRLEAEDLFVDYSKNAFGYGIEPVGACFGTEYTLRAMRTGHMIATNGIQTSYNASLWWQAGVPQQPKIDIIARESRNAPLDIHWAIRPQITQCIVDYATQDATSPASSNAAMMIGAIDPWFGKVWARGVRALLSIRDCKGLATRYEFSDVDFRNPALPFSSPLIVTQTLTGSVPIIVEIKSGTIAIPGHYPFNDFGVTTGAGYIVRARNVTFIGGIGLCRWSGGTKMQVEFESGCVWRAEDESVNGVARYEVNTDSMLTIWDLAIKRGPGGTFPNGLIRATGAFTCVTRYGQITVDGAAIPWPTSGSDGGATLTQVPLTRVGGVLSSGTTGGAGSAGAGNQFVQITVNGVTYKALHDGTV